MTYEMERETCKTCKKVNYCVLIGLDWFCDECFSWKVEHAEKKDKIILSLTEYQKFGMEDIEKYVDL